MPIGLAPPVKPAAPRPTRDTTFDLTLQRPAEVFPPGTELHVIGVYEGALPAGVENQAWWANCRNEDGQLEVTAECHQKYATQHKQRKVTVDISYQQPMVLALTSYEPVLWEISSRRPEQLKKVILAGYHGQDITGIGKDVPVDAYTYEASTCQGCQKKTGYFYTYKGKGTEYDKAVAQLRNITGLEVKSFQGSYKANSFAINSSTVRQNEKHQGQAVSSALKPGQWCKGQVVIANTPISLPPGDWQVVEYLNLPATDKADAVIALAQQEQNVLKGLYAVRVEILGDNNGFANNLSCDGSNNFFNHTVTNTQKGDQLCYWIEHLNSPWQQPFLELTASRLKSMGIQVPADAINTGFRKADRNTSVTAYLISNPEAASIYTQPTSWAASPWHNTRIHKDPKREAFMAEQQRWAQIWFQFFKLH